jgi:hypothetical protein
MQKEPTVPATLQKQEMQIPFPLAKELFSFAEESGLNQSSYSEYTKEELKDGEVNPSAKSLPEKFSSLVADFPGNYFLVAYEKRIGDYYAKGTRFKMAVISNTDYRAKSNDRIREINIKEYDPSEGKGNVLFVTVSDSVNEQDLTTLNSDINEKVNLPHGDAEVTYQVGMDGTKKQISFRADRLDEEFFTWKGEQKQVRWLRNLAVEREGRVPVTNYKESYLIGLKPQGGSEELVDIKFKVVGHLIDPESIQIDIGFGPEQTAQVLYEDKNKKIKVLFHRPVIKDSNPLEVLKQDPSYSFLFEEPINTEKLLDTLKSKIKGLEKDWDKTQNVFSSPESLSYTPQQIENK